MCPPKKRNVPHFTFLSVTLPFLFDFGHLGTQKKLCIPNRSYFIYIWAFLVTQTEKNQTEKNLPAVREDLGSIPGSGRPPGEGNGYPLQYTCLENPMDRGAWQATVHGVAKVRHD